MSAGPESTPAKLLSCLERARDRGFLGPGPVTDHLVQAERMARVIERVVDTPARVVDLGSGAGVPGLPLALRWESSVWWLVDGSTSRCELLEQAIQELGLQQRVEAVAARAEEVGRGPLRNRADLVVARSFGPPAVVAECAAPLLRVGGHLAVSEPPESTGDRWDAPDALQRVGLELVGGPVDGVQCLVLARPCPDRYPRRVGIPSKRPLF